MNFFDEFPRFYENGLVTPERINKRWHAIIEPNKHILTGKRVLDIASHDGRWSIAALKADCTSVIGIEARNHLVDRAYDNLTHYGIEQSRFQFICTDAIDYLRQSHIEVDVVLLLGFYYHINCHMEFAELIANTGASHIILDTGVALDNAPLIRLIAEATDKQANAIGGSPTVVVGFPSRSAIDLIFRHAGFAASEFNWTSILNQYGPTRVEDYQSRERATFILQRQ